jgi:predicted hydrocarbon binding protein
MIMIFKTRFGTLDLPKDDCITCIYVGKYMSCSMCEFRWGLIEDAAEPFYARQRAVQEASANEM